MGRRRVIIPIHEQFLSNLLKLPKGTRVLGFDTNHRMFTIDVHVEGPEFDEVPDFVEAPRVAPTYISVSPYYSMIPMSGDTPIYDEVMNDLQRLS